MTRYIDEDPDSPFYGADATTLGNMYRELVGVLLSKTGPQRITEEDIVVYRASQLEPYMEGEGTGYFDLMLKHEDDL